PPPVRQARSGWLLSPKGPTPLGRVDVVVGPAPSSDTETYSRTIAPEGCLPQNMFFRVPAIATRRPAPSPSWEQGACREIFALQKATNAHQHRFESMVRASRPSPLREDHSVVPARQGLRKLPSALQDPEPVVGPH